MKKLTLLIAVSLVFPLNTTISSTASARECWSGVGATAVADEQSSNFIVRGALPAPLVFDGGSTSGTPPKRPIGPVVAVGNTFDLQDHMVSLSPSAPAGTYRLRYDLVPTSFFSGGPNDVMQAIIYVQDNKRDRIVVQLKEIRYRTSGLPTDLDPHVKTIGVVDTANDPWVYGENVPAERFVALPSVFALATTKGVDAPKEAREYVHYYIEVLLITDRQPAPVGNITSSQTGKIRGPALALVSVCPRTDLNSCFFQDKDFSGGMFCMRGYDSIPVLGAAWDKKISSFWVAEGGIMLVCEQPHFSGWCGTYSGRVHELTGGRDNAISSIMRIR